MVLSYLVSTAAHAQEQNEANPHDIRSILQLIKEGSEEFGDEKVVGFTGLQENGEWKCDRYCEFLRSSTSFTSSQTRQTLTPSL